MDNPLEQPAPEDSIAQVHAFALDLAYGVAKGLWESGFNIAYARNGEIWIPRQSSQMTFRDTLKPKWSNSHPSSDMLRSFGYLELDLSRLGQGDPVVLLTPKAFMLLERPVSPPEVFISYKQSESSAFASLIEARLKLADPDIGVFIDKVLEGGDEWERRIKKNVWDCDTFVCVFGKTTHESTMIPREIAWALASDSRIVPVLHNGYKGDENYPDELRDIHWIAVESEKAEGYELAILKLLNTLGYPTLQSPHSTATN